MQWGSDTVDGLPTATEDPVLCSECGALFGGGAEAETVCPYCSGDLHPIPEARHILDADAHADDRRTGR